MKANSGIADAVGSRRGEVAYENETGNSSWTSISPFPLAHPSRGSAKSSRYGWFLFHWIFIEKGSEWQLLKAPTLVADFIGNDVLSRRQMKAIRPRRFFLIAPSGSLMCFFSRLYRVSFGRDALTLHSTWSEVFVKFLEEARNACRETSGIVQNYTRLPAGNTSESYRLG